MLLLRIVGRCNFDSGLHNLILLIQYGMKKHIYICVRKVSYMHRRIKIHVTATDSVAQSVEQLCIMLLTWV